MICLLRQRGVAMAEPFGKGELEIIRDALVKQQNHFQANLRRAIARTDIKAVQKWSVKVGNTRGILYTIHRQLHNYPEEKR